MSQKLSSAAVMIGAVRAILLHLAYRANKRVISNNNVTDLKAREKRALGDVNFYC